jgi:PAS domain-containing protein
MFHARAFVCQWDEGTLSLSIAGDLGVALGFSEDELGEPGFILHRLGEHASVARMFKYLQDHAATNADQPFDTYLDVHHRDGHLERLRWRGHVTPDSKGRLGQWLGLATLEGYAPAPTSLSAHKPQGRPAPARIGAFHWLPETDAFHADGFYHRLIGVPRQTAPGSIQSGYLAYIEPSALAEVRQRWNAALAGRADELTLDVTRRCADGVVRRFRDELVICRDHQRRPTRIGAAVLLLD